MIYLRPYIDSDFEKLSYQLDKTQAEFTSTIAYCVDERMDLDDPNKIIVTIVEEATAEVVGFFVLDTGADKFTVTDNDEAVLIRSLSLNPNYQGKGYGRQAMQLTAGFVTEHQLGANELVLSVNFRNLGAYHLYLKSGFLDTGKIIVGVAGEQHVMSLEFN